MAPRLGPIRRLTSAFCIVALSSACASTGAPSVSPATEDVYAGALGTGQKSAQAEPEPDRSIGPFRRWRAMAHLRALARDIGVRVRATEGERRGAAYVAREFRSLGYDVFVQKFSVDSGTSRNVIATWPGAQRYPIILGGHMDSVPTSPGANDNASGVSVLLEIARLVRGTVQGQLVKFIAFGSEEFGSDGTHHVGSQVYVDRLGTTGKKRLAGMISVDMISDGRPLIVGSFGIGPRILGRILYRRLKKTDIAVTYQTLCDCSDNGPFEHAGLPGAFMYSGRTSNYHNDSDTVANMVPADLERTGKAVRAFVESINRSLLRRLRRA
jgi:hypothetical protein